MELRNILKEKLEAMDLLALAKKVGYGDAKKGKNRIVSLVDKDYFGLCDNGCYDLVHSNSSLLKSLCKALEINNILYEKTCYAIELLKEDIKKSNYRHIYIHTDFKRKSEPIFALAALECKRRLYNLNFLRGFTLEHQIKEVAQVVKEHYINNIGKLEFWGNIKNYVYHYDAKKEPIIFDIEGKIVNKVIYESSATMSLK